MKKIEEQIIEIIAKDSCFGINCIDGDKRDCIICAKETVKEILSEVTIDVVCPDCLNGKHSKYSFYIGTCLKCNGLGKVKLTLKQAIERLQSLCQ